MLQPTKNAFKCWLRRPIFKSKWRRIIPNRIVKLIEKLDDFDAARRERMSFKLIEPFTHTDFSDADKELLRSALRRRIHWHRNYRQRFRAKSWSRNSHVMKQLIRRLSRPILFCVTGGYLQTWDGPNFLYVHATGQECIRLPTTWLEKWRSNRTPRGVRIRRLALALPK